MPVRVHADGLGRQAEALETTVYFCCLEGLQNVAKHAGADASVAIRLNEADGYVRFTVRTTAPASIPPPSSAAPASPTSPIASRPSAERCGSTRARPRDARHRRRADAASAIAVADEARRNRVITPRG